MTSFPEEQVYAREPRRRGAVLIIGTGAVGGYLAVALARLGISPLRLVDRDVLSVENLIRHPLGAQDVGQPKAPALARRIRTDFPTCNAFGEDTDFLALDEPQQLAIIGQADVVVAATDSLDCQRRINELCVRLRIAALYPGIWAADDIRDGEVGALLHVNPGEETPCYQCYTNWRPQLGDTESRGGSGADLEQFALTVAWAVVCLFEPDDPHAEIFDPERTLTLVHSNSSASESIAHLFRSGNTRNLRVPFPRTRCPICNGREASRGGARSRPRPPVPTPVDPEPGSLLDSPMTDRPVTAAPSGEIGILRRFGTPTGTGGGARVSSGQPRSVGLVRQSRAPVRRQTTPASNLWLVGRASWLLTTIAVFLFSARLGSSIRSTSNPFVIVLDGVWLLAVVAYGGYRTFRSRRRTDVSDPQMTWSFAGLSVLLLVISTVVLTYHTAASAQASPGSSPSAEPAPATSQPETASTSFNIHPTFNAQNDTVTGVTYDSPGDAISVNLASSLHGFELKVRVSAAYTASDIANLGISSTQDFAHNCMDISLSAENSPDSSTYYESPVKADLSENANGTVSGTLIYGAVLPGSYRFDLDCLSRDGQQGGTVLVGTVSTPNVGVVAGTGDNDNALVVFTERKSPTDTAILYGAIGSTGDGSEAHPTLSACIVNSPPQQNPVTVSEGSTSVNQQESGNGQWFELGAMTFNLSASQLSGPQFFYDCSNTNGGGLSLP